MNKILTPAFQMNAWLVGSWLCLIYSAYFDVGYWTAISWGVCLVNVNIWQLAIYLDKRIKS